MNLFQTVVGIDPSGKRLTLAAIRGGFGPPALIAPPLVYDLRSEKEQQLLSEVEGVLGDFAARHGLAGSAARLCIPADRIYSARVSFPPIREKDLRPALELELETGHLVLLDVEGFPIERHWYLVERKGKRLSVVAQAFKDFVLEEAGQFVNIPKAGQHKGS